MPTWATAGRAQRSAEPAFAAPQRGRRHSPGKRAELALQWDGFGCPATRSQTATLDRSRALSPRNLIKRFFCMLKHFCRIATPFRQARKQLPRRRPARLNPEHRFCKPFANQAG
jgi:hypothetical protein